MQTSGRPSPGARAVTMAALMVLPALACSAGGGHASDLDASSGSAETMPDAAPPAPPSSGTDAESMAVPSDDTGDGTTDAVVPAASIDAALVDADVEAAAPDPYPPYPGGPYCPTAADAGLTVGTGCILQNMRWIGYSDPDADALATTKPYAPYSLDDARKSGKRYLLIDIADTDCSTCQVSAGVLASEGPAVEQAGGLVVDLLVTTGYTAIASKADLDGWATKYGLPVTVMKDPDGSAGTPSSTALGHVVQAYIVDLQTMKVVMATSGMPASSPDASFVDPATMALVDMRRLLGI